VKRILCILSSLEAGGAETFLMKVSRALPADAYQLDFVVSKTGGCYTEEVLERGGRIFFVPLRTKKPVSAMIEMARIVRDNRFDCVLKLTDTPLGVVDLIAAKIGGAKKLAVRSCNALSGLSWKKRVLYGALRPLLNWLTDVKIAPSMLAAEFTFGKREAHRNVHIVHNAVDLRVFCFDPAGRKTIRDEFGLKDKFVVGHIGRFAHQKNHPFLLETFKFIHDKVPNAVLMLVGTGALMEQAQKKAEQLGILSSVLFLGQRFDIPQILSAMDVFVFPSFHEGMPNTVIEAQATGLPCIIADTITRDADITGLVQYLSLDSGASNWADAACSKMDAGERSDTKLAFEKAGYDIERVASHLCELLL